MCRRAMRGVSAASVYVHALLLRVSCAGCASAEVAGGAGAHRWALLGCSSRMRNREEEDVDPPHGISNTAPRIIPQLS